MQANQDKDTSKTKTQVWIKHTVQETNKIPATERLSAPVLGPFQPPVQWVLSNSWGDGGGEDKVGWAWR